jgi:hypothetical protein
MNDVTISILVVGAVILIALVVVYFGLVRRRRYCRRRPDQIWVVSLIPYLILAVGPDPHHRASNDYEAKGRDEHGDIGRQGRALCR